MPTTNSAARLLKILERVHSIPTNAQTSRAWAQLLGVEESPDHRRDREVARLLGLMHDELEKVRSCLRAQQIGLDPYEPHLQRIERALTLQSLAGGWDNVRGQLTEPAMAVLRIVPGILRESEPEIDPEALKELSEYLSKLQADIVSGGLPDQVKQFLLHQLALVWRAIREYPIRGAEAFRHASEEATTEWMRHRDLVEPHLSAPEVKHVAGLWPRIEKLATRAVLIGELMRMLVGGGGYILEGMRILQLLPPRVEQSAPSQNSASPSEPDFEVLFDTDAPAPTKQT